MLDYHEAQLFLYREARLMDTHAYDAWLAMWASTAHYWIPCNEDELDVNRHVSLVNEDRAGLEDRISRLKSGAHYAQDPKSRLSRVVSNVELETGASQEELRRIFIGQLGRQLARIDARIEPGNRIVVRSTNVVRATLYLSDRLVDLDRPVTVVWNGRSRRHTVARSVAFLLEHLRETGDLGRRFVAAIRVP